MDKYVIVQRKNEQHLLVFKQMKRIIKYAFLPIFQQIEFCYCSMSLLLFKRNMIIFHYI